MSSTQAFDTRLTTIDNVARYLQIKSWSDAQYDSAVGSRVFCTAADGTRLAMLATCWADDSRLQTR